MCKNNIPNSEIEELKVILKDIIQSMDNDIHFFDSKGADKLNKWLEKNNINGTEKMKEIAEQLPIDLKKDFIDIFASKDVLMQTYRGKIKVEPYIVYGIDNERNLCNILIYDSAVHIISPKEIDLYDPQLERFLGTYAFSRKTKQSNFELTLLVCENVKMYGMEEVQD